MTTPKESIITGLLAIIVCVGGYIQAQNDKKDDELKFVSLEQYEKRSKVLQIREKLLSEISAKTQRDKSVQSMEATFYSAVRMRQGDEQIVELINLRRRVLEVSHEISDAAGRQVELAGLIDNAMAAGGLLPQVQNYLNEARTQLRSMGIAQDALQKKLQVSLKQIDMAVQNVPPPASFKTSGGIEFRLVAAGANSFYISAFPVGENATLEEAYRASVEMTNKEGVLYKLPDAAEVRVLSQLDMKPAKAIWTLQGWGDDDAENVRMSQRFGVKMYTVWDPQGTMGRGVTFGELLFARYQEIGYYLVTSSRTGWLDRWNRIAASMK